MAGLCKGGNEPPSSLKANELVSTQTGTDDGGDQNNNILLNNHVSKTPN